MKKLISVLLVLSMLFAVLAGCGSSASSSGEAAASAQEESAASDSEAAASEESVQEDASAEAAEESAEASAAESAEESAEEAAEESSAEESSAEPAEETAEPEPVSYTLPLTEEPETFTVYTTAAPGFMAAYLGADGSYNTAESTLAFAETTGVTLEYIEIDMMSFSDNFNLMIASGEYPDILTGVDGYAGGYTKALDDGIILELTDYVKNNMPAYWSKVQEMDVEKEIMTDDGQILSIASLNDRIIVDRGPVIRQDWLDALGLEAPTTYDEWYDVGLAMLSAYDIDYAFYISNVINPSITFSAGYDLPEMDFTVSGSHFYQVDGEVTSAYVSENFKEYLTLLANWYSAGLISKDFFMMMSDDVKTVFAGDGCAICWDNADYITEDNTNAELAATGFYCTGIPVPVQEEGQTLHFSLNADSLVQSGVCISTDCENVDLLIKTMDYSFTEEGALLSNYGLEGISYEFDENGDPQWTEAMTNVEGQTFRATIVTYVLTGLPTCITVDKYWSQTMDEDSLNALDLWGSTDTDGAYDLPSNLYFTTEESEAYASKITDLETYASEYTLACITGANDIEATWDSFVETLWSMGLQDCIDAKQSAYDRYLIRGEEETE